MDLIRKVRLELLAYIPLMVEREELQLWISNMDDDISPSLSRFDDMPIAKGGIPKSTVEGAAIRREELNQTLTLRLERLDRRIASIGAAMESLDELERSVIHMTFHSVDYSQLEIAETLNLSVDEMEWFKYRAMQRIGRRLKL